MQKILVATDIHGSAERGRLIVDAFRKEGADKLVLLGDIYYHGPRNPLPAGHGPMELCGLLNEVKDDLICVRGNCDADVDLMISEFEFLGPTLLSAGGKRLFLTHGHESVCVPDEADAVLRGHFHVNSDEVVKGKRTLGIASASLPKGSSAASYAVIFDGQIVYKRLLDGAELMKIEL